MDISRYQDLKIAPRAVFDSLPERRSRVRFMVQGDTAADWRAVTWGAFAESIRHATLFLAATELESGDRAAIFSANSVEWLSAALAIQARGGVMVPVYPSCTAEQAAYVLSHSDAKVVFVDGDAQLGRVLGSLGTLPGLERIVLLSDLDPARVLADLRARGVDAPGFAEVERLMVSWSHAQAIGAARDQEDPLAFDRLVSSVSLDQPGLMLYTSGTSGNPKGVPLTHRNVAVNGLDWLRSNAPLVDEGAVDLLWLPMSHIFGFGEACLGNTLGFLTYLATPATVLPCLPEVRPTVFMSVPMVWEKIASGVLAETTAERRSARFEELTGGRLRFCLSGGAGLKREVKELFYEEGALIIEGYGLTETSPTLTLNRPDAFRFDSVGKPLPSVELELAPDGEIWARGPSVFSGYHKDPVATREAFTADGWFKTGDIGRFTDDGFLQIVDRKKEILVTSGGKNVPPANIEVRLRDDPFIAHLVVYGDGKRYLVAGVWLHEDAVRAHLALVEPDARAGATRTLVDRRIQVLNAELASHETIKRFAIMDRPLTVEGGLLTPTLKIRRKKIYEVFRDRFEALYEEGGLCR
ncbi:MAG: long-chain fatty acid--CoA ligase [Deltaproteobacteria bacterium]|nr:long-chain fatty acid--CoA ligase [Deltaproteobacteria bacterium]